MFTCLNKTGVLYLTVITALSVSHFASVAHAQEDETSVATSSTDVTCPTSPDDLLFARDKLIQDLLNPRFPYIEGASNVSNCYSGTQPVPACLKRAIDVSKALTVPLPLSPQARQDNAPPKDLMKSELLALIQRGDVNKAAEYVTKLNRSRPANKQLIAAAFRSQIEDMECFRWKGRFLVYEPGNPERWINFSFRHPDDNPTADDNGISYGSPSCDVTHSFSVLSITTKNNGERVTYINDYISKSNSRDEIFGNSKSDQDAKYRFLVENSPTNDGTCLKCHKNGPIPAAAEDRYAKQFASQLELINKPMKRADWINDRRVEIWGPPIGADYDRTAEEMMACMNPLKSEEGFEALNDRQTFKLTATHVRNAMTCAYCHGDDKPDSPAMLNYPVFLEPDKKYQPSWVQIHLGKMPKKSKIALNELEKKTLMRCLGTEYYGRDGQDGIFQKWLKEVNCQ